MYRTEQDPIKKEERKVKLMRETIPFYLRKFEKVVADNGGYSVGTDVRFFFRLSFLFSIYFFYMISLFSF